MPTFIKILKSAIVHIADNIKKYIKIIITYLYNKIVKDDKIELSATEITVQRYFFKINKIHTIMSMIGFLFMYLKIFSSYTLMFLKVLKNVSVCLFIADIVLSTVGVSKIKDYLDNYNPSVLLNNVSEES